MGNIKGLAQSKTVWGIIIAAAATLLGPKFRALVGDEANQAAIVDQIVQLIGLLWALYGRITARAEIKGLTGSEQPK